MIESTNFKSSDNQSQNCIVIPQIINDNNFFHQQWIKNVKSLWKALKIKANIELKLLKSLYIKEAINRRFEYLKSNPKKMIDSILKIFKKQIITD